MWRAWCTAACVAAVLAVVMGSPTTADEKTDAPSVKDIMTKAHKGADSLLGKLKTEVKAGEPDWAAVQKQTKELVRLGDSLAKAKPPRGDDESWKANTAGYQTAVKKLDTAAADKDVKATEGSLNKLTTTCVTCHKAHKAK
jgi:cytochrome c556